MESRGSFTSRTAPLTFRRLVTWESDLLISRRSPAEVNQVFHFSYCETPLPAAIPRRAAEHVAMDRSRGLTSRRRWCRGPESNYYGTSRPDFRSNLPSSRRYRARNWTVSLSLSRLGSACTWGSGAI